MPDGLTWRENIRIEIEKVKKMNRAEKWSYFKTYYLVKTLIALTALILIIWFVYDMKQASREVLISGCMVNVEMDDEGYVFLTDGYQNYLGIDEKEGITQISPDNYLDFLGEQQMDNYSYEMALMAQIAAGDFDYMILDEAAYEHFLDAEIYADVNNVLSADQLELCKDRLTGEEGVTTAVDISGTAFAKKYQVAPEKVYLVFVDIDLNVERCRDFLDFVLYGSIEE